MRVLIVKLSSLGDLFHALPAVHALKIGMGASIDWVVNREYVDVVRCFTDVDDVIPFPRRDFFSSFPLFARTLRRRHASVASGSCHFTPKLRLVMRRSAMAARARSTGVREDSSGTSTSTGSMRSARPAASMANSLRARSASAPSAGVPWAGCQSTGRSTGSSARSAA